MAGKSATLAIKIVSDAKGAAGGFTEAEKGVGRFQDKLDRASVAAGGVLAGIAGVAKEAFDSASKLQQSSGAVESVFGAEAAAIKKLAEGSAQAVGLSTSSYQELASGLGAQLSGMGYAGKELTGTTESLIGTGADLAATFGGSTEDAVSALSSLMRGERDPIEKYGIALSQAAVDAKTAAMGLDTSTPAAKRAADAQATLALVAEQSAGAQGAFARESDTAAGAQQRAAAEFENAKASLGEVLLPIVAQAMTMFQQLSQFLVANKDVIIPLVAVIGGFAAAVLAVNGAFRMYTAIVRAAAIVQGVLNIVMAANPIGLIIIAIVAIVALVIVMYNKFGWFRDLIASIGDFFSSVFDGFMDALDWIMDKLSFIGDAASWVGDLFGVGAVMPITPVAAGSVSGMFGAAGGGGPAASYAALSGAPSIASAGGGSTAGRGSAPVTVNVQVGIGDPVAIGRELERILRQYAQATGSAVALTVGRKR